jgi:hypothetical protein
MADHNMNGEFLPIEESAVFGHDTSYRTTATDIGDSFLQRTNLVWEDDTGEDCEVKRCIRLMTGTSLRTTNAHLNQIYAILIEDMEPEFSADLTDPSGRRMIGVMDPRNRHIFATNCVEIGEENRVRIFHPEKTFEDLNYCRVLKIEATFPDHVDMDAKFDCCCTYSGGERGAEMSRDICLGLLEMVATSGASEVRLEDTRNRNKPQSLFVPPYILVRILEAPALRRLVLQSPMSEYGKRGLQESRQANEFTSVVRAEFERLELIMTVGGNWSWEPY